MSSTDRPMPSMSRLYKSVAFALCASSLHPFSAAIAQQSEQEEAQAIANVSLGDLRKAITSLQVAA